MLATLSRFLMAAAAVLVLAAPAAAPALSADAESTAVEQAAPTIRVVAAERRELVETISVTGTILPRQEAVVGIDLAGLIVTELRVEQGDRVEKGEVIAVLDRRALDTQLAQIDASRAQAEATIAQLQAQVGDAEVGVRQAQEAFERAQTLRDKGVTAEAQLDNAVNALDSAKAKLTSAEKALAASEAQLGVIDAQRENVLLQIAKTEVRAPASGLVLERNATLGAVVGASAGPLFRIAIDAEFELVANVAETELPRLREKMPVAVSLAGSEQPLAGSIRLIAPEIDRASRLGHVRVALPEHDSVRAGSFARGWIEVLRREAIVVPVSAVVYRDREPFLQRVANGVVATVPVKLGARADGYVEVVEGLVEGDEVVSRAGTFVADGDKVTPVRAEETGALVR